MNTVDLASASVNEKREAAYEIKFVVSTATAGAVLSWAREHLAPDPYAEGNGDIYHVNSLYFETKDLDVYQRKASYGKTKYRIRRYGSADVLFLERKLKTGGLVSKRRTRIPDGDLWRLATAEREPDWIGQWFRRRLEVRRLSPKCQIRYERVARLGMTAEGPIRLTVDRDVRAFLSTDFGIAEEGEWIALLPDRCILELKFRLAMPALFKQLLTEVPLTPQPTSKYRLSIQAFGLDPAVERNGQPHQGNGHISADALAVNHQPVRVEVPAAPRET